MSNLILKSYIEDFAALMATESYKLIKSEARTKRNKLHRDVSTRFVKHFISKIVFDSLTELTNNKMSTKEAYDTTKASFLDIKIKLQEEVANGFEQAFMKYTGQQVDYYCQIEAIPEALNKEPI